MPAANPPPPPVVPPQRAPTPLDCLPGNPAINWLMGRSLRDILIAIGWVDNTGRWTFAENVRAWAAKENNWRADIANVLTQGGAGILDAAVTALNGMARGAAFASGCPSPDISVAALAELLIGAIDRWVADVPDILKLPWAYFSGWQCPVEIPHSDWCNQALATNTISYGDWRCLVRLNGDAEKWQSLDVTMRQNRPTDVDLLGLLRKGWIDDAQYGQVMSRLGWTDPSMRNLWEWSQIWTPSPQDAVQWMIKDVSDPLIQQTFGLGLEFQLKYQGDSKFAFEAAGVPQQFAEDIWRAHWRNIEPHQLFEMHKRLRPGFYDTWDDDTILNFALSIAPRRPTGPGAQAEIDQRQQFYGTDKIWSDTILNVADARVYLALLVTESFHLYEALGQADYPPFWRDRLSAISYNVLTRVDARRAYEIGAIDESRLQAVLQDQGYAPADAEALVKFYRKNYLLLMSRKPACNQWVNTGYSLSLLQQVMLDQGLRPDLWDDLLLILQHRRSVYVQVKCLTQWKKDYSRRLYTEQEIRVKLTNLGLQIGEVNDILLQWDCERAAPHKQAAAAALCNEFKTGVITEAQLRQSLSDLKFRTRDIRRMVSQCKLVPAPKRWGKAAAAEPDALPGDE